MSKKRVIPGARLRAGRGPSAARARTLNDPLIAGVR
jgi:hypothetical protein